MFHVEVEATGTEHLIQKCDFILATRMLKGRIFSSFKNKSTSVHMNRHGERNPGKGDHGDYESCLWGSLRREMVAEEGAGEAQAVSPSTLAPSSVRPTEVRRIL